MNRLTTIIITLIAALSIWYVAATYPFGQTEKDVISLEGAPQKIVTLTEGNTVTQSFRTLQPLVSSFSIYVVNNRLTNQQLSLTITTPLGQSQVSGNTVRTSRRDGKLKLTFPVPWLETASQQAFVLRLTHEEGNPLKLFTTTENVYRGGYLSVYNKPAEDLDLSLTTTQPTPTSPATRKGVAAGLVTLIGALLIHLIPKRFSRWQWASAGLLIVIVTPLALGGFWQSRDLLGIDDWDYYFSVHEVLRHSLVTLHAFPFWNPYTCGGTAGLADPEFPLFTPTFLLELTLGIPLGLRLAIFLSTAIGALGMLALAKRVGLSVEAALLAALAAFFGTVNLLEIVEGHPNIFAAMWIPWIFWSWLGAYRGRDRPLICGIFLALTFFQGGIYLLFYTSAAFLVLIILSPNRRAAFSITFKAGLWALGFAAIKLIPAIFWLSQFQDETYASSTITLPYLYEILLGRHLHGVEILPNQGTGWHEYGAYLGPLVIALSLLGITKIRRHRIACALVISAVLAILLSSAGPLLKPVFDILPFIPRSTISRVIFFAVIPISLLAGLGLDQIRRWNSHARTFTPVIIGLVAVSLMSLTYPLSQQAFTVPRTNASIALAPSPIAFTKQTLIKRVGNTGHTRSYLATLAGFGALNYCTPLSPKPSVITVGSESDSSIVTTDSHHGSVKLISWSPNKIRARAVINQPTDVKVNTNYAKGWQVNGQPVYNIAGRVGISLEPGTHDLTFRYRAPGFIPGLGITIIAILFASWHYFRFVKRK